MKRFIVVLAAVLPVAAWGQQGVVAVHPANPEGRMMTMEEAVMGTGTRVASTWASWVDENTYACMKDGKVSAFDVRTGESVDLGQDKPGARPGRGPRGSVISPSGIAAYTKGKSLYINDGAEICVAESENDQINYGQSVSRNEFGLMEASSGLLTAQSWRSTGKTRAVSLISPSWTSAPGQEPS